LAQGSPLFVFQSPTFPNLSCRDSAIYFDCTPHIGEIGGIVLRTEVNWKVYQYLIGVRHVDSCLDTDGLGVLLDDILRDAGFTWKQVIGTGRDAANLNGAVLDALRKDLKRAVDIACFSHMFNRTGECLASPIVTAFMGLFAQHFGHSAPVHPSHSFFYLLHLVLFTYVGRCRVQEGLRC
jgi:hypothetical protein